MVHFRKVNSHALVANAGTLDPAVLMLSGPEDSPEHHWQHQWRRLFGFAEVDFEDWETPTLHGWTRKLEEAVERAPENLILVGHSLGCLAAAWWARTSGRARKVVGALLVAPPDVDREDCPKPLRDFRPAPIEPLPFRSVLMASRNDPHSSFEYSRKLARTWRSEFIDCGKAGHIDADSGLGCWTTGLSQLTRLMHLRGSRREKANPVS